MYLHICAQGHAHYWTQCIILMTYYRTRTAQKAKANQQTASAVSQSYYAHYILSVALTIDLLLCEPALKRGGLGLIRIESMSAIVLTDHL